MNAVLCKASQMSIKSFHRIASVAVQSGGGEEKSWNFSHEFAYNWKKHMSNEAVAVCEWYKYHHGTHRHMEL